MNPDTGLLEWVKQDEVDAHNEALKTPNIVKISPSGIAELKFDS